ncbi:hypothetical protein M413DRAFT_379044 [Hebeloma cylindrosporum]|uniref:Uncharacterized protein n=1 Tax=Hebeloma cylindrosporum TaxID=76867 RepID=A0A0C2Y396_HEBCY|nr:hypothetical protein M413DRAFT_379044 [Hebeloma cylindrosporum h7]
MFFFGSRRRQYPFPDNDSWGVPRRQKRIQKKSILENSGLCGPVSKIGTVLFRKSAPASTMFWRASRSSLTARGVIGHSGVSSSSSCEILFRCQGGRISTPSQIQRNTLVDIG